MLLGQGLGLPFCETALRQALDEPVGIEGDGLGHSPIIGSAPYGDKGRAGRGDGADAGAERRARSGNGCAGRGEGGEACAPTPWRAGGGQPRSLRARSAQFRQGALPPGPPEVNKKRIKG